ncbi:MAG: hypothetical protein PCFJNLEI_01208 [Verrucomicrobiae bacterium]|nr:hypothetical protein [Verrucomicrobiae bacterium]
MNELQLFLHALKQPEYLHVLLNPLPMYGLAMGLLALLLALLLRSRPARVVALVLVALSCASVWPVVRYGHGGYDRVSAMSNNEAKQWLDVHQHRADRAKYIFYLAGLLALAALAADWKFPRAALPLAVATLVLAVVSSGLGGWIAHAGGKVRHSEFRDGPPPNPIEPSQREEHHKHSH